MNDYSPKWTDIIGDICDLDGISTELMDAELLDKIYREHTDPGDDDEWNEFPEIRK